MPAQSWGWTARRRWWESVDLATRRHAAQQENCGFTLEVRNLADADATLEEWVLVMQYIKFYKLFVWHAATEVVRVRRMRWEQRQEETKPALLASPGAGGAEDCPNQELQDRDNANATEN